MAGKVADLFNDSMDQLEGMASEMGRISRVVGKEEKSNNVPRRDL